VAGPVRSVRERSPRPPKCVVDKPREGDHLGMDFLVLGATGRTGSAFTRQAIEKGHRVSALVRDPSKTVLDGAALTTGDVLDEAAVRSVVREHHVIVIALSGAAIVNGSANVIRAAELARARRLVGVVGAGVLQADATRLRNQLPDYPPPLRQIGAGHLAFYEALKSSSLDWTLACTPRLVEGPKTDALRMTADYLPGGTGLVTTEDVAAFLLEETLAPRFIGSRVGLNSAK